MIKHEKPAAVAILVLAWGLCMTGCREESVPDSTVSFCVTSKIMDTDHLSDVPFDISIDPAAPADSRITIAMLSAGGHAGKAFTTTPETVQGEIELTVNENDTNVSFIVIPIEEGIGYEDVEIDFEIFSVGPGLKTEGLAGVFSTLYIENRKVLNSIPIPYIESFENCASGGSGQIPAGWREVVVLQNSLNTAHWVCTSFPGTGLAINAYHDDGFDGDSSEVWIISPKIRLTDASNPVLSFRVDRRFETDDFQEYDLRISTDYDGGNFDTASWEVLTSAVDAIEANDPAVDEYSNTGELDISAYAGEEISIAFIYYAVGSKLTATILRIVDVEVREAG